MTPKGRSEPLIWESPTLLQPWSNVVCALGIGVQKKGGGGGISYACLSLPVWLCRSRSGSMCWTWCRSLHRWRALHWVMQKKTGETNVGLSADWFSEAILVSSLALISYLSPCRPPDTHLRWKTQTPHHVIVLWTQGIGAFQSRPRWNECPCSRQRSVSIIYPLTRVSCLCNWNINGIVFVAFL